MGARRALAALGTAAWVRAFTAAAVAGDELDLAAGLAHLWRNVGFLQVREIDVGRRPGQLARLVAQALHLGVGLVEIRKSHNRWIAPNKRVLRSTAPPDYNDRDQVLEVQRHALNPSDHVLLVDEWMATGAQATAARELIERAEAELSAPNK